MLFVCTHLLLCLAFSYNRNQLLDRLAHNLLMFS